MEAAMFSLVLILAASGPVATPPHAEQALQRVGQVIVIGNELTRDDILLRCLAMYPGQVLTAPHGAVAARRLAGLRLLGIRARWSIAEPAADSAYKDIMITVEETWLTRLLLGPRAKVNDLVGMMSSSVQEVGGACFGKDHNLSILARVARGLCERVYAIAPAETLSAACGESMSLACMVDVFIRLPDLLTGVAPILGAPRE
jgi:hypothetical protein